MPGLNQRGPQGQGPMTGRGQGVCQNQGAGQGFARGGFAGQGFQGGRGGKRGCGRGLGRGFGPGLGQGQAQFAETSLEARAKTLEEELKAIKAQLNAMSENQ
ncbi:MAG: DUF5320 domain-containing protein [Desulfobacter sp.]|nr:DUF5320 domain-containing protein [Desulfobacter sp.]WDP85311.1 MAG: DUF5320 domain-containing protein [Desulfobacter sp.]